MGRAVLSAVAFVAGLAGTAGLLTSAAGRSPVPEFSDKLADLAAQSDQCEILFLGSSRVRRQISPQVFDASLREHGLEMASYNFGLDGMTYPEILYVADEILATKPRGLKFVFVELTRFSRGFGPVSQPDAQRTIHWHTPRYTALICRAIWNDPEHPPLAERWSVIGQHVEIFLRRACNVGRGVELVENGGRLTEPRKRMGPDGDGFFPVRQTFPKARLAEYARQLAELPTILREPATTEALFAATVLELLRKFQRAGITPVIVTMPRIHPATPWVPEPDGSEPRWMVLRFDDPAKTDLFDPALHYDPQHLNAEGAKVFSRRLAEQFAAQLQARAETKGPVL